MKPLSLKQFYTEYVAEAHSVTDFPVALGKLVQIQIVDLFSTDNTSTFNSWMRKSSVGSFRKEDRLSFTNLPLLKKKNEGSGNEEGTLYEVNYQIQAETYSLDLVITRQMVVNDSLNAFGDLAQGFITSAIDTQSELAVTTLVNPGLAYDGIAFYNDSSHSNDSTYTDAGVAPFAPTINTANALVAARVKMLNQRDPYHPERFIGKKPNYIVCAPSYFNNLQLILTSDTVVDPANDVMVPNPAKNLISPANLIEEPRLESYIGLGDYIYMLLDPVQRPGFEVAYLNGQDSPEVFMKESPLIRLNGGGRSDFDYPFDDITYHARLDFGMNTAEPRAVLRLQRA